MEKIKVGVLGLGRGMTFARQFNALPETSTAAICDDNAKRVESALASLGTEGIKAYDAYEDMVATDLDVIVVASGAPDHAKHGVMALEAGKHVLSEVPADVSLEACKDLVKTVEKTGRKYMLAENTCYYGFVKQWQREVAAGRIGEVMYAEGEYLHDVRGLYHRNPTLPRGTSHEEIARHPDTVRTWRATLHPVNYLTHDLGPILEVLDDRCVSVSCLSTPSSLGPGYCAAAEVAIFKTAKGRVIKELVSFSLPRPSHHYFMFMGTRGSIESPRGASRDHLLYAEGENMNGWSRMSWDSRILSGPQEAWASGHGGADWHISRAFTDAIINDGPSPIDVYRAMDYTVPGICAVESSAKGGAAVEIPDLREL